MVRYHDAGGGTGAPYLGRHRKVPPQVRAASRLGQRLATAARSGRGAQDDAKGGAAAPEPDEVTGTGHDGRDEPDERAEQVHGVPAAAPADEAHGARAAAEADEAHGARAAAPADEAYGAHAAS